MPTIPANAIIDEATLALFYTGRSNANSLTLGVHGVLAGWTPNVANRVQRLTGANWNVPGLGAGSDYTASPAATLAVADAGGAWVELDVTDPAQAWVADPGQNHGLVLLQAAVSGYVVYNFCSEVAQAPATPPPPCLVGHAPKLTLRYHLWNLCRSKPLSNAVPVVTPATSPPTSMVREAATTVRPICV